MLSNQFIKQNLMSITDLCWFAATTSGQLSAMLLLKSAWSALSRPPSPPPEHNLWKALPHTFGLSLRSFLQSAAFSEGCMCTATGASYWTTT